MGAIGKNVLTVAVGLLLAAGVPYVGAKTVHADPGSGSGSECCRYEGCGPDCPHRGECPGCPGTGCEYGCPMGAGKAVPPCMQDNAAAAPGGMHRRMHGGGGPMKEGMGRHMEEMRGTIAKLRALEAKMEALKAKDDAAAFRAASLEHAKLLTDLQDSHLKHMEGMMGGT